MKNKVFQSSAKACGTQTGNLSLMKKKIPAIFSAIIFLLGLMFFVSSQNQNAQISTEGPAGGIIITQYGEDFEYSFTKEGAILKIGENSFENILPADKSLNPSFVKASLDGTITEADLTADKNGGEYWINDVKVNLRAGERVYYNEKENKFYLFNGASITDSNIDFQKFPDKAFTIKTEKAVPVLGILLNGEATLSKEGHLLKSGSANFNNMQLNAKKGQVLIAKENFDTSKYSGNWIQPGQNKLEMQSTASGNFEVKFLENSILKNKKYTKFDVDISKGDGLKIELVPGGKIPVINHKFSENGETTIKNGASTSKLNKHNAFTSSEISTEDILSERYLGVPSLIISDSVLIPEQIEINEYGQSRTRKYFRIISDYENKNIAFLLKETEHNDLKKIANALKENSPENADEILNDNLIVDIMKIGKINLGSAKKAVPLIEKAIKASGENSKEVLFQLEDSAFVSYMRNQDPNKFAEMAEKIIKSAKETNNLENLRYSLNFAENSLSNENKKIALSTISSYVEEMHKSKTKLSETDYIHSEKAIEEYNGKNFAEIEKGIKISTQYELNPFTVNQLKNFRYSDIQDKESLAKIYASAINQISREEKSTEKTIMNRLAATIDIMHDKEDAIEKSDLIRDKIINDLSFESKYYLLSNAGQSLYVSTFEKMYQTFPENFVEQIKTIDPKREHAAQFTLELANKGKLENILQKDPQFFTDSIKKGLSIDRREIDNPTVLKQTEENLFLNSVFTINTIDEIYKNPSYKKEKEEFEKFLVERYNNAESKNIEGAYAYLLKMNENPLTNEAYFISENLPEITPPTIPKRFFEKETLSMKIYFDFSSYGGFEESQKAYEKYGMKTTKNKNNEIILEQTLSNRKKIRINMEWIPFKDPEEVLSNEEIVKNDEYQIIVHRGHFYTSGQPFNIPSKTDKIIYLGGCGSFSKCLPEVQKLYPNAQIISDQDVGVSNINQDASYRLLKDIAEGKRDWGSIKPAYADNEGLVYPDDLAYIMKRYIEKYSNQ